MALPERIGIDQKTNSLTSVQAKVVVALRTNLQVLFQPLVIHEGAALQALCPAIGGQRPNANREFRSHRWQHSRLYRHTSSPPILPPTPLKRGAWRIPSSPRRDA